MNIYDKLMKSKGMLEDNLVNEKKPRKTLNSGCVTFNLLCSGKIDVAVESGTITTFPAPSALGKSMIAMYLLRDAQKKGFNCVYFDCEKSFDFNLAKRLGIKTDKKSLPIIEGNSIENLESNIMSLVDGLSKEEKENILVIVDSWQVLETIKSVQDAVEHNDKKDMTKVLKQNRLANMMLNSDITFFIINHISANIGGYGDPMSIPGGKRLIYVSKYVILGRSKSKLKDKAGLQQGMIIKAKSYKSRGGKENSELEYRIDFDGGLSPFYGLLPDALEAGVVEKPKKGAYIRKCVEADKDWKEEAVYCTDFWLPIFKETNFREYLERKYSFSESNYRIDETLDMGASE